MSALRTEPCWRGRHFDKLVAASSVNSVKESRASARPQLGDAGLKLVLIVGVVLGDVGCDIEAHDEGQIGPVAG